MQEPHATMENWLQEQILWHSRTPHETKRDISLSIKFNSVYLRRKRKLGYVNSAQSGKKHIFFLFIQLEWPFFFSKWLQCDFQAIAMLNNDIFKAMLHIQFHFLTILFSRSIYAQGTLKLFTATCQLQVKLTHFR